MWEVQLPHLEKATKGCFECEWATKENVGRIMAPKRPYEVLTTMSSFLASFSSLVIVLSFMHPQVSRRMLYLADYNMSRRHIPSDLRCVRKTRIYFSTKPSITSSVCYDHVPPLQELGRGLRVLSQPKTLYSTFIMFHTPSDYRCQADNQNSDDKISVPSPSGIIVYDTALPYQHKHGGRAKILCLRGSVSNYIPMRF
jgi:hypothetical protein